jgi:hypothetical protein
MSAVGTGIGFRTDFAAARLALDERHAMTAGGGGAAKLSQPARVRKAQTLGAYSSCQSITSLPPKNFDGPGDFVEIR